MLRSVFQLAAIFLLASTASMSISAPVAYTFTTGESTSPLATTLFGNGAKVSGSFLYDSEAPFVENFFNGRNYGGHSPSSSPIASFSAFSAVVSGISFSDPRGVALVGNDRIDPDFPVPVDIFQLRADPAFNNNASPHNIGAFAASGYTLVNIRFLWIETLATPGVIPDFLESDSLLAGPPAFDGRLAFDFIETGSGATLPTNFAFFDSVKVIAVSPVPEPEMFSLVVAGLCLLGVATRCRSEAKYRHKNA